MSSTTSSECESCDCSQCNYSFENNHNDYGKLLMNSRHIPMYATMAHPLVYYAEIQQPINRRQTNDQLKKDTPFKKAFKWYTQERTLCNKTDVAPEKSGFADWLDNKYVEYLHETGQQMKAPTSHEPRVPKTSTAESCPPCPVTTKKFGRFKSPWRKRRHPGNDSGDVPEKCPHHGSCEFLLKPKELTRAASEPSYHTPTSGDKSNSTVASSNMPCNTKCSGRSHSLSDVACEKSTLKHGDTVPHAVQEFPTCQEQAPTKLATTSSAYHQKQGRTKLPKSMCVCSHEQGPSKEQNVWNQAGSLCKCLQEKVAELVKVQSTEQDATNQVGPDCKCVQRKVRKVLSKAQDATNQAGSPYKCLQEKVAEVVRVPSNEQSATNQPKPVQGKVRKVPSKEQCLANQLGPCCKCNLEKVPKVVQVPSQSRAVEESCQYPEEKVVPVHEETQYEPAPEPPRSTQNLGSCYGKTCNKSILPPPQVPYIPVKEQSKKIASPEMCFTIAPAQNVAPKKHKTKQCVFCQSGEGNRSKVDTPSQHQPEPSACCKDTAASLNSSHEVNQVFGPIPIRRESYSTVAINEETGEYSIVKEVTVVNKFTRSVTCASNNAAQTSDHSIRFEKEPCSSHPLFFKIICTDVSKND